MKIISLILIFITTLLFAQEEVSSAVVVDTESYSHDHELHYGLSNNYSFLVAKHQLRTEGCLIFYYGTKIGLVYEDYTTSNGFGPTPQQYSVIIKANAGLKYQVSDHQQLSFEGSRTEEQLRDHTQSKISLGYNYRF